MKLLKNLDLAENQGKAYKQKNKKIKSEFSLIHLLFFYFLLKTRYL
jgi:hypothetical protein